MFRQDYFPKPLLPSQLTLLLSTASYYFLCNWLKRYLSDSHRPTLTQLHQSRELLSIVHGTLVTAASIFTLRRYSAAIFPDTASSRSETAVVYPTDSDLPLSTTRSELLNCVTALETGYLAIDLLALYPLLRHSAAVRRPRRRTENSVGQHDDNSNVTSESATVKVSQNEDGDEIKGSANPTVLAIHHAIILLALLVLHLLYIPFNRERGGLVIVMMLLMNASNPLGSLRWWVVNFSNSSSRTSHPGGLTGGTARQMTLRSLTWLYLSVYAAVRVVGVGWLLHIWGLQLSLVTPTVVGSPRQISAARAVRPSIWTVLWNLRPLCRNGTALIWAGNSAWLGIGLWKAARREWRKKRKES